MNKPDVGDVVVDMLLNPRRISRVICMRPDGLTAVELEDGAHALVTWHHLYGFYITTEWVNVNR